MRIGLKAFAVAASLAASTSVMAIPTNFSFAGSFLQDDNVQLFNFSVGAASSVTLVSYGYAGGTQASGNVVARGGFDTILALFNATTGALIQQNDDSPGVTCGPVTVHTDSVTGALFDTCLNLNLAAGNYTVAVMEFDNFAIGPNLAAGFVRTGQGNFTGALCTNHKFCDVTGVAAGNNRSNAWAFDILNVDAATQNPVPEPASLALVGLALACAGLGRRKTRR